MKNVIFKANSWSYTEGNSIDFNTWQVSEGYPEFVMHISGITAKGKTVYCNVTGFMPSIYLELPKSIKWNTSKARSVYLWVCSLCHPAFAPVKFECKKKKKPPGKQIVLTLHIHFRSYAAVRFISKKINDMRSIQINGLEKNFTKGSFIVHEHNLDPIIKFTAERKLPLADWLVVKNTPVNKDEKLSSCDIEVLAKYEDLYAYSMNKFVPIYPKIISFDLECYSRNHNSRLPDPNNPFNKIFHIGSVVGKLGGPYTSYMFTLFNPKNIKNVKVIRCKTEKELILKWIDHVIDYDPDIFGGYNIMKFDWQYLIQRCRLLQILDHIEKLSRIFDDPARVRKMSWSSSAYKEQEYEYVECNGRFNVDVLIEVERNYRLPLYNLNHVAEKFLGDKKDDVSARQLFMLYKITNDSTNTKTPLGKVLQGKGMLGSKERKQYIRYIKEVMILRQTSGEVLTLRKALLKAKTKEDIKDLIRNGMTITATYCDKDCVLVLKLMEKLHLRTAMEEASNVMYVPMSYLHTRGQQIKVIAQVYREMLDMGFILPYIPKKTTPSVKYQGATVIKAVPGDYDDVLTLDFASLYPSIIIGCNICYITIKTPNSDETTEYLPIEWEDHRYCPHDPQGRKGKKELVLCGSHHYEYEKIRVDPDGTIHNEGILPRLERKLLSTRKAIRKELAKLEARYKMTTGTASDKDLDFYKKVGWEIIPKGTLTDREVFLLESEINTLNAQQLQRKVCANSVYGGMGFQDGMLPLVEGAMTVCAEGRRLIMKSIEEILRRYEHANLVYGDSVTGSTPVLVKRYNGNMFYVCIRDIPPGPGCSWQQYGDKWMTTPEPGLEVWSDTGFTPIKVLIKHFTNKKLYRVTTFTGSVEVTEDHSLLDENSEKVTPDTVAIGDTLLHTNLPCGHSSLRPPTKVMYKNALDAAEGIMKLVCPYTLDYYDGRYVVTFGIPFNNDSDRIIRKEYIGRSDDYVYDLETENHHFAAGVGRLVVHNTDSCMINFPGREFKSKRELFELGDTISDEITHYLKCEMLQIPEDYSIRIGKKKYPLSNFPMDLIDKATDSDKIIIHTYNLNPTNLEFENLYSRYLLMTKKRYMALMCNREGQIIGKTKKGVVLTRRDNCQYLKTTYDKMSSMILNSPSNSPELKEGMMNYLYDQVHALFTMQVPDQHLAIYVGVGNILGYAKTNVHGEYLDANDTRKEKDLKEGEELDIIKDEDGKPIMGKDIDPLDPRLKYPNIPQVLLVLKMLRRGDKIPSNTRLEYVYLEPKYEVKHQGEYAEEYTFYKENKSLLGLQPNHLHYVAKQLTNPITEMLTTKFPKVKVPYEKLEDKLERCIKSADEMVQYNLKSLKNKYVKELYNGERTYKITGKNNVIVQFILDYREGGCYASKQFKVSKKRHAELIEVCLMWKSRNLIKKLLKQHGMNVSSIREKAPTQRSPKLRLSIKNEPLQIIFLERYLGYPKGSEGSLRAVYEKEIESYTKLGRLSKKKAYEYTYDIVMFDGVKLDKVPRKVFTTYRYKDSTVMDDIYRYRYYYKHTVKHLSTTYDSVRNGKELSEYDLEEPELLEDTNLEYDSESDSDSTYV